MKLQFMILVIEKRLSQHKSTDKINLILNLQFVCLNEELSWGLYYQLEEPFRGVNSQAISNSKS